MSWTYAQVKAADAAQGIADITLAAEGLNKQTTAATVDVPRATVEGYLLLNGILPGMQEWAAAHPTDTTGVLAAVQDLEDLIAAQDLAQIAMSDPATNAAVTKMLGALVTAGLMTSAQQSALLAMASAQVPVWQPTLLPGDIQTARAQP